MSQVDDILAKLDGVRKRGKNRWFARCPVHNEKTGSLSIQENPDGRVLMYCFGCGANFPEICKAIGYEYRRTPWIEDTRSLTPSGFHVREVARAMRDELSVAWILLTDIAGGKVLGKDDRERARVCARRCAAMMEELSE